MMKINRDHFPSFKKNYFFYINTSFNIIDHVIIPLVDHMINDQLFWSLIMLLYFK